LGFRPVAVGGSLVQKWDRAGIKGKEKHTHTSLQKQYKKDGIHKIENKKYNIRYQTYKNI